MRTSTRYQVREVGTAQLPALREIASGYGLLHHWPQRPDFLDCERELGRQLVALRAGAVVGFGGTFARGTITHLADLFIEADSQSAGAGRALLDRLFSGTGARVTFASPDTRAVASYIRYGLLPRCPLYYLSGPAAGIGTGVDDVQPSTVESVLTRDAAASGGERPGLLRWYAERPGVRAYLGGTGYVVAREVGPDVVIGPAGADTPEEATRVVRAVAAWYPDRTLKLLVPGTHPLLPALLAAGLRITDTDTFLATSGDLVPLDRYLPQPDLG